MDWHTLRSSAIFAVVQVEVKTANAGSIMRQR